MQFYLRDPAGNLVEIDWPDVTTLEHAWIVSDLKKLDDDVPQTGDALRATLFLALRDEDAVAGGGPTT